MEISVGSNVDFYSIPRPKVSIVVPCYKTEQYLDRCVESLANQTLREIEIILVDDGSPDRVPQMCDERAKKDSRIRVIHKQNAGLGYARNSGMEIATGEYIAFVDSDDWVDTDTYRVAYEEAERNPSLDAVFFGLEYHDSRQNRKSVMTPLRWTGKHRIRECLLDYVSPPDKRQQICMSANTAIYKLSTIHRNDIKFLSEREIVYEDILFKAQFIINSSDIAQVSMPCYHYCFNRDSLTNTFAPKKWEKYLGAYRRLLDMVGHDTEGVRWIDQLFIIFSFEYMASLVNSRYPDKIGLAKNMTENSVWPEIALRYKPCYILSCRLVSLHQYLVLNMIYKNHPCLLLKTEKIIQLIKKALKNRS